MAYYPGEGPYGPPMDSLDVEFDEDAYMCRDISKGKPFGKAGLKGIGKKGGRGAPLPFSDKGLAADQIAQFKHFERDFGCCPFYLKIGACRHGDQCSRLHNRPVSSNTLLLQHVYQVPQEAYSVAVDEEFDDGKYDVAQKHVEEFYDEIFHYLAKFGEVDDVILVDNVSEHMMGNVYVKYYREEDAERAMQKLVGKYYNGQLIKAEFSPVTDFRDARCRSHHETVCNRGGFCNFMHIKHVPRVHKLRCLKEMYEDHPHYDTKSFHKAEKKLRKEAAESAGLNKGQVKQTVPITKPKRLLTLDETGEIMPVPDKVKDYRGGNNWWGGGGGGWVDDGWGGEKGWGPPDKGGWYDSGKGGWGPPHEKGGPLPVAMPVGHGPGGPGVAVMGHAGPTQLPPDVMPPPGKDGGYGYPGKDGMPPGTPAWDPKGKGWDPAMDPHGKGLVPMSGKGGPVAWGPGHPGWGPGQPSPLHMDPTMVTAIDAGAQSDNPYANMQTAAIGAAAGAGGHPPGYASAGHTPAGGLTPAAGMVPGALPTAAQATGAAASGTPPPHGNAPQEKGTNSTMSSPLDNAALAGGGGVYGAYGATGGPGKPPRYEPYDKDFFDKGKGKGGKGKAPGGKGWARGGADGGGGNPNDIPVGM